MIKIESDIEKESKKKEEMFVLYLTLKGKKVRQQTLLRNFSKLDKNKIHLLLRSMIWELVEEAFRGI